HEHAHNPAHSAASFRLVLDGIAKGRGAGLFVHGSSNRKSIQPNSADLAFELPRRRYQLGPPLRAATLRRQRPYALTRVRVKYGASSAWVFGPERFRSEGTRLNSSHLVISYAVFC